MAIGCHGRTKGDVEVKPRRVVGPSPTSPPTPPEVSSPALSGGAAPRATARDVGGETMLDTEAPGITIRSAPTSAPKDTIKMPPRWQASTPAATLLDEAPPDTVEPQRALVRGMLRGAADGARVPRVEEAERTLASGVLARAVARRETAAALYEAEATALTPSGPRAFRVEEPNDGAATLPLGRGTAPHQEYDGTVTIPLGVPAVDEARKPAFEDQDGEAPSDETEAAESRAPTLKRPPPAARLSVPVEVQTLPIDAPPVLPVDTVLTVPPSASLTSADGRVVVKVTSSEVTAAFKASALDEGAASWWKIVVGVVVVGALLGWLVGRMLH